MLVVNKEVREVIASLVRRTEVKKPLVSCLLVNSTVIA